MKTDCRKNIKIRTSCKKKGQKSRKRNGRVNERIEEDAPLRGAFRGEHRGTGHSHGLGPEAAQQGRHHLCRPPGQGRHPAGDFRGSGLRGGAFRQGGAAAQRVRGGRDGQGGEAGRGCEREPGHRGDRGSGGEPEDSVRGGDAAFPCGREFTDERRTSSEIPLSGPAQAGPAEEPDAAQPDDGGCPCLPGGGGIPGGGDPYPEQVHPGGGQGLSGAQPHPPGLLLCPAPVAPSSC